MIKTLKTGALMALCIFAAAGTAAAQTAATGFNVQDLIMKLSLFLPEDVSGGGAGFRAPPPGGGTATNQPKTGAQAQNPGTAQPRPQFQYTRDQKLFLTKDQTGKLIPMLQGLRENPLPSPTKAKKLEADVAAILTAAQKAEYDKYLKAMEKARQDFQKSGNAQGQAPNFRNMTDAERQQFLGSLPADQRQRLQDRAGQGSQGGTGGAQLSQTERRQRQLDEFIVVMQNWEKKAK